MKPWMSLPKKEKNHGYELVHKGDVNYKKLLKKPDKMMDNTKPENDGLKKKAKRI